MTKRDKLEQIETYISYRDPRSDKGVTTFGAHEDGLFYNYDDRLPNWDRQHLQAARNENLDRHTAMCYERALESFHGKAVDLRHIVCGSNLANGHPWMMFGYFINN